MINTTQAAELRKLIDILVEATEDAAYAGSYTVSDAQEIRKIKVEAQAAVDDYIRVLLKGGEGVRLF